MKKVHLLVLLFLLAVGFLSAQRWVTEVSQTSFRVNFDYTGWGYNGVGVYVIGPGYSYEYQSYSVSGSFYASWYGTVQPNSTYTMYIRFYTPAGGWGGYYWSEPFYAYTTTYAATLISPINGTQVPGGGYVGVSWNAPTGGASSYKLYCDTFSPPTTLISYGSSSTSNSVPAANYSTVYYWRVVTVNSQGHEGQSAQSYFQTQALPAPSAPTSSAATNNTTTGFRANWGAVAYASTYYLDVSTVSNFASYVSGYQNLNVGNVLYKDVTGLSPNTTYYYRVRAYNTSGTSSNSTTQTTATKPNTVTLTSPANSSTGLTLSPTLSWSAPSGGATGYKVYAWQTSNSAWIVNGTTTTATTYDLSGLSLGTEYSWNIVAYNAYQDAATSSTWSFTTENLPGNITNPSPANSATALAVDTNLSWSAPASGATPTSYTVYFDTVNPPLASFDNALNLSYEPGDLLYNTTYYWTVVPYTGANPAPNASVNSFTTQDFYVADATPVDTGSGIVTPEITIPDVSGEFVPVVTTDYQPESLPSMNVGLAITIAGVDLAGRLIEIDPGLGFIPSEIAFRILPAASFTFVPRELDWAADYVYFTVPAAKADGDLEIIFPEGEDQTLPVTLSSFTATLTADLFVKLAWVTESETENAGYNILRSEVSEASSAYMVNSGLISQGSNQGGQISYVYTDLETLPNCVYYYWLQSMSISGNATLYGPLQITTSNNPEDPGIPEIPNVTELMNSYPNPFNPSTSIPYKLQAGSDVRIDIYNARGQKIQSYSRTHSNPGRYQIVWDGKNSNGVEQPSGVYFFHMVSDGYSSTNKAIMLK